MSGRRASSRDRLPPMSYRTILVYADAHPEAAVRIRIAASIALNADASVDGVFVAPPFVPPPVGIDGTAYVDPAIVRAWLDSHRLTVAQAAETARGQFQSIVEEVGARAQWSVLEDTICNGFVMRARCADLAVFPRAGMTAPALSAADFVYDSGAPVVLVPKSATAFRRDYKVLLAWDGGREAANALRGSWPILEAADLVQVLMIDPLPEAEAFIAEPLARHGVRAETVIDRSPRAGAGDIILSHARSLSAD